MTKGISKHAMRILLFNYHGNKPNPVYDVLAEALRERGHEVVVAAVDEEGSFSWHGADGDNMLTIPLERAPKLPPSLPLATRLSTGWVAFKLMLAAREVIRELEPDIIQINTERFPWLLAKGLPANSHVAYDIRQINEAVRPGWRTKIREKWNFQTKRFWTKRVFERTFFCHSEAASYIGGEDWRRYATVVPVGVDELFLDFPEAALARAEDDDVVRFVYVGSLSKLRNLEQLISAADLLRRHTTAFQVTIAGRDYTDGYFQRVVDELDLGDFVTIHPPLPYDEIPAFLAEHHVGLAYVPDRPTWHYQPTIKVLEYRALGLPILSTDVKSHRKFVEDGVNGVMVGDDPAAVAAGMMQFIEPRLRLAEMSANARRMREGLTWDGVAAMYERTYRALTGRAELSEGAVLAAQALSKGDPSEI